MHNALCESMTQEHAFDGQPATLVKLTNKLGMSITLMDIGATWLSCIVPLANEQREVLLGVSSMSDFKKHSSYMGVTVGRYANRIARGQFDINGQHYQTDTNQTGNTLHGGLNGFDKRRWDIVAKNDSSVTFSLISPDGDQGFPGTLKVCVSYQLSENNQVDIRYQATTDKATPVNLTNHAYFNLLGAESGADCKSHMLYINAKHYLPTDKHGIPVGELQPVNQSSFDFNKPKMINQHFLSDAQQQDAKGYDHSYLLNKDCQQGHCAVNVSSPDKKLTLNLVTDKPAVHLYTGNWLAGTPNREADYYADYAGLALETQFLPDSPNHPEWQQTCPILQVGDDYSYQTTYQFITNP